MVVKEIPASVQITALQTIGIVLAVFGIVMIAVIIVITCRHLLAGTDAVRIIMISVFMVLTGVIIFAGGSYRKQQLNAGSTAHEFTSAKILQKGK